MDVVDVMFPYGRDERTVPLPRRNLRDVIRPPEFTHIGDERAAVTTSLRTPICSIPLRELARGAHSVAIIVSDKTRPVPHSILLPSILEELHAGGILDGDITIVVALGMHDPMSDEELVEMVGEDVVSSIRVVNHDCMDESRLTNLGTTSRGTPLTIADAVAAADLVISTGYIEPHEFAGFTGGRKSVLPGVAGIEALKHNHRIEMLDDPRAMLGILEGNPIHEDMVEAARTVGVDFIVNVVLDNEARISGIFSGDVVKAHEAGVAYYKEHAGVLRSERADIVVASVGHPLNRDLYQSLKAVFATAPFVADGGTIILYTSSSDGMGPALFRKWMTETDDPSTFSERIVREGFDPRIDHCYLLQRVMCSTRVCIVSEQDELSSIPFITLYRDIEAALADAFDRHGSDASIIAVPYATRIIPLQG